MRDLNRRYREKFGFPCIVALRLHAERGSVMREMERRLGNNADTELAQRPGADRPHHPRTPGEAHG